MTPRDARFAKRFLVVAPGITIRDRLGVLHPEREENYYRERDLVPPDLWEALLQAQVEVTNYHAFLPRDAKEIQGVASNTRKLLRAGRSEEADAFRETPEMVADRVLRSFGSTEGGIVVFNDEAHHCYQDKALEHPDDEADKEDLERNREARVWFRGLVDLNRRTSLKAVYDLSATPYYLKGSVAADGLAVGRVRVTRQPLIAEPPAVTVTSPWKLPGHWPATALPAEHCVPAGGGEELE